MKRALVTGARGFVGANLTRRLVADGHDVHVLVRQGGDPWRIRDVAPAVHHRVGSLDDRAAVARTVRMLRPQWVFNLAAFGAYPAQTDLGTMAATNILGTANLLQEALDAGCEAFVQAGSSSEYGSKDHPPTEEDRLEPNSYYGITKAAATLLCRHIGTRRAAPVRTLRLYSVYGPWEEPSRLMPRLLRRAQQGAFPPLAHPATARDYVWVEDAVEAFVLAAVTPGQEPGTVYNVGTGRQSSLAELVELVRRHLRVAANPDWGTFPARPWDTDVWVADSQRIAAALGWRPRCSLGEGVRRFAEWLSQPDIASLYRARDDG